MNWSYSGNTGAQHWGDLAPEFAACKLGCKQSPVNIVRARTANLDALEFDLHSSPLHLVNNGHSIQANYAPGSFLAVGAEKYQLLQFHFHQPSEHKINGEAFPLEAHAVFESVEKQLVVVAILFEESPSAPLDTPLQTLWQYLPERSGEKYSPPGITINLADLLPKKLGYYRYEGSLTTPPCTEGVRWFLLRERLPITPEQIARFAALYPHNARPLQALNDREILTSAD
ncbi:MAG: carbonic anhydrase [Gammaproteobacteria bacterium]